MIEALRAAVRALQRRVLLMVGRAVLLLVDEETRLQSLQVRGLVDEVLDPVERFQQYGFTSHPHPGAECVLLAAGGMRQHPIVVAVDDRRYRVTGLAPGEVCLYTDEDAADLPHRITLRRGRRIRLDAGSTSLELEPAGMTLVTPSGRQTWGAV